MTTLSFKVAFDWRESVLLIRYVGPTNHPDVNKAHALAANDVADAVTREVRFVPFVRVRPANMPELPENVWTVRRVGDELRRRLSLHPALRAFRVVVISEDLDDKAGA